MLYETFKVMAISFLIAIILMLPMISWAYGYHWAVEGFPLGWFAGGLSYMGTFFHEIGHSLAAWYLGYPSIPTFDWTYGGGVAFHGQQNYFIAGVVDVLLGYTAWKLWPDLKGLAVFIALLIPLQWLLIILEWDSVLHLLMGHGAELIMASFFLLRAVMDLAPRGIIERYLNGVLGFGLVFDNILLFWGLMTDEIQQLVYAQQKGMWHMGDLSRIADQLSMSVEGVGFFMLLLSVVCLVLPFFIFMRNRHNSI